VVTPTPQTTPSPQVGDVILIGEGGRTTIEYRETGPVLVQRCHDGELIPGDINSLSVEVLTIIDKGLTPNGLRPFSLAAEESFSTLVSLIEDASLTQVKSMIDEYESNIHAIKQVADDAGVDLSDIWLGNTTARIGYENATGRIYVLRRAIAEVEREREIEE
jgi:hypothetical protein